MKPMRKLFRGLSTALIFGFFFSLSTSAIAAEPLSLKRTVELALLHSPAAAQSASDEQRAFATYRESRNQYYPQLVVGSGLGDTWGYPLSLEGIAPSLVNVTAQSSLFNLALRDYIRAAHSEFQATLYSGKDQRNQIIHDTVLTYLQLMRWEQLLPHLQQQHDDAVEAQQIIDQRVQAGVDNPQLLNQARLSAARANLHLAQADGAVHELRLALSQLTGVPVDQIQIASDSVPTLPDAPQQPETVEAAANSSPNVLFARQHAITEAFRARAEHRALWPTADFATQYAVLAKFNNWLQFFPNSVFQRNNATVGLVLRFPLFSAAQKAHAAAADAEATRANNEVEASKNQVSQQILKLQDSVRQLTAAKEISDLEYEIAKSNADTIEVKVNSGSATVPEASSARAEMFEKYDASQDADFALLRAKIGLLRATGDLESWALHKQ